MLAPTWFASASTLINGEFEQAEEKGKPAGWTVLTDLDKVGYGPPDYSYRFTAVDPTVTVPGRGGHGHALAFPAEGTWRCEVGEHNAGQIDGQPVTVSGSLRGKAAAYQRVLLQPGQYRFGAYLRTADGDGWSGGFSLGIALNGTTQYAHDNSTGISWTKASLGMRGNPEGDYPEWGEWRRYTTESFELKQAGTISVWIRFNYVNQHQTNVRWEVDDADVESLSTSPTEVLLLDGVYDEQKTAQISEVANFCLNLKPLATWTSVAIRFRESEDHHDGFALTIHSDGTAELRSIRDGLLRSIPAPLAPTSPPVRVIARNQYLRVDLSNTTGFETRIIGPKSGTFSVQTSPPDARIQVRLANAPSELPALSFPVAGEFKKTYDPSVGEAGPWYINDHCLVREPNGPWHMFGITHAEPFAPNDEDFFAHAMTADLMQIPWKKQPPVCHVNEAAGETHVWAPHVIRAGDTYYMFYCGGGPNGDAYQMNLRTSKDLTNWEWHEGNPLFVDIGNARDPMVLPLDGGRYLMYYTRPASRDDRYSAVAVRQSTDLLHWSDPSIALVTSRKDHNARLTESPFVFRHTHKNDSAYYLSATGLGGGYRGTVVWRSLDPTHFDADQVVAEINAHAPEWISTAASPSHYVTHCGWRQGGVFLAPVEWSRKPWIPFGVLVVKRPSHLAGHPITLTVQRRESDKSPYRTLRPASDVTAYSLPPARYRVTASIDENETFGTFPLEIKDNARTYLDLP